MARWAADGDETAVVQRRQLRKQISVADETCEHCGAVWRVTTETMVPVRARPSTRTVDGVRLRPEGMTLQAVADEYGCTNSFISQIEKGKIAPEVAAKYRAAIDRLLRLRGLTPTERQP